MTAALCRTAIFEGVQRPGAFNDISLGVDRPQCRKHVAIQKNRGFKQQASVRFAKLLATFAMGVSFWKSRLNVISER